MLLIIAVVQAGLCWDSECKRRIKNEHTMITAETQKMIDDSMIKYYGIAKVAAEVLAYAASAIFMGGGVVHVHRWNKERKRNKLRRHL